ncbi:transcriptional regulator with AbiEi antitoxin domain of type IV toxin-antitoxin system, partial [Pseudidiomarina maritima]
FLYLAEKANHDWMQYLDLSSVNLGSGKRAIVASGVYIPKYQITVPVELESME